MKINHSIRSPYFYDIETLNVNENLYTTINIRENSIFLFILTLFKLLVLKAIFYLQVSSIEISKAFILK